MYGVGKGFREGGGSPEGDGRLEGEGLEGEERKGAGLEREERGEDLKGERGLEDEGCGRLGTARGGRAGS